MLFAVVLVLVLVPVLVLVLVLELAVRRFPFAVLLLLLLFLRCFVLPALDRLGNFAGLLAVADVDVLDLLVGVVLQCPGYSGVEGRPADPSSTGSCLILNGGGTFDLLRAVLAVVSSEGAGGMLVIMAADVGESGALSAELARMPPAAAVALATTDASL